MTGRSHQNSSKSHANETIQFRLLIAVAFSVVLLTRLAMSLDPASTRLCDCG